MTHVDSEQPFFFGRDGELFGIHHAAAVRGGRAVLLCAPLGQDYIRCHRLYRQLATALAAQGMPVLRFDYYGCGDSAGDSTQVDWRRCLSDTLAAAGELRRRSGAERVLAFGARLGGSIALAVGAAARFDDIVVWDPVIDGSAYVAAQDALQDAMRLDTRRFIRPRAWADAQGQWTGFAVSPLLRGQIGGLHAGWSAAPSLLLDSLAAKPPHDWLGVVADPARIRRLDATTPWDDLERLETAILSHALVQAVSDHWKEHAYA
ncbi:alpha/beta fold hydrolase [Dyella sedimenti]|uniref:alpha/beta fold hydrolase n=1 Tax=Dyella sedimenti TaxID=2919947 RepID=UPI001FAA7182|nr:alpha/beta fold hydrolase [Dyella sedimenti]